MRHNTILDTFSAATITGPAFGTTRLGAKRWTTPTASPRCDAEIAGTAVLMRHRLQATRWPRKSSAVVGRTRLGPGEQPRTTAHRRGR